MYDETTTILGADGVSAAIIQAWFASHNPNAPANLGSAIRDQAVAAGIRPVFLAAEIDDETAHWESNFAVNRNNPSGLGAIDSAPGNALSFPTIEAGVEATCAHWLTEIMGAANPMKDKDPRFAILVAQPYAGTIRTVGQIGNGVWATARDYSTSIITRANDLLAFAANYSPSPAPDPQPVPQGGSMQVVDLRDQLTTNPNGGPNTAAAPKLGVVIHYNGPVVTNDAVTQFKIDATYHCQEDWGGGARGDGIMYHLGIGDEPADHSPAAVYLLRNLDAELWHCASWAPGGNGTGFSVQVPIGEGQSAGAGQLAALSALSDALRNDAQFITDSGQTVSIPNGRGIPREMVKGHQELSSTACPGTLMNDFVLPYRAGQDAPVPTPAPAPLYFSETGKTVDPTFVDYFNQYGGLHTFGFPVTDAVTESDRKVQYFQRNVMEEHLENAPESGWRIETRLLGAQAAADAGFTGPGIPAPSSAAA